MKDDDLKLLRGFDYRQTDRQTDGRMDRWSDICECRAAFVTEKYLCMSQKYYEKYCIGASMSNFWTC